MLISDDFSNSTADPSHLHFVDDLLLFFSSIFLSLTSNFSFNPLNASVALI